MNGGVTINEDVLIQNTGLKPFVILGTRNIKMKRVNTKMYRLGSPSVELTKAWERTRRVRRRPRN